MATYEEVRQASNALVRMPAGEMADHLRLNLMALLAQYWSERGFGTFNQLFDEYLFNAEKFV